MGAPLATAISDHLERETGRIVLGRIYTRILVSAPWRAAIDWDAAPMGIGTSWNVGPASKQKCGWCRSSTRALLEPLRGLYIKINEQSSK